jgi:hypothetical protein
MWCGAGAASDVGDVVWCDVGDVMWVMWCVGDEM